MSCAPSLARFRLLNHLVGWDDDTVEGLTGMDSASGLRLQSLGGIEDTLDEAELSLHIPPARLGRACGVCEWYLVTPYPPCSRILVMNACNPCWSIPFVGIQDVLSYTRGIAVSPNRIAVSDEGDNTVVLYADRGRHLLGKVPFASPGVVAYASWHEWLVVDEVNRSLERLDMAGSRLGPLPAILPGGPDTPIDRIAVDEACRIWVAIRLPDKRYQLWIADRNSTEFTKSNRAELQQAFAPTELASVFESGFCFNGIGAREVEPCADESSTTGKECGPCFNWYGRTIVEPPAAEPVKQYVEQGQLLTLAIDSGIPRCRWHRVRIDADMPAGTTTEIAVAVSDLSSPAAQGIADANWTAFSPGLPHPADWQAAPLNSTDFLVRQPAGRYLFVRIRLRGDGLNTPQIKRIRLDMPRESSLNELPYVYRENPEAEEFGERFLSLFDAFLEDADSIIERFPALFDFAASPEEILPWLGQFLDIAMDPAWDANHRRQILKAASRLYRMRGTPDGIRSALRLVFGVDAVIREHGLERPWGGVGEIRLNGGARLFGRSSWRFRLDQSRLSGAPLRSFGNPDRDPFNALAYRLEVMVPVALGSEERERMERLIDSQKPAHTVAVLRDGSSDFVLGEPVRVGIDTGFGPFTASVLGHEEAGLRLGRNLVLSSGRSSGIKGIQLNRSAVVGCAQQIG